jgi:hypothetical protein
LRDPFGKVRLVARPTTRANFDFGLMLHNFDLDRRNVQDLSFLHTVRRNLIQGKLAVVASAHPMYFHPNGLGNHLQRIPGVPRLPAAFLLVSFTLTLGRWLLVSIAGWRFAAVAAILRHLVFQRLDPFHQTGDRLCHSMKEGDDGFFSFPVGRSHFLFCGYVYVVWRHPPYCLAFSLFFNSDY